jgi:hypothetical protein
MYSNKKEEHPLDGQLRFCKIALIICLLSLGAIFYNIDWQAAKADPGVKYRLLQRDYPVESGLYIFNDGDYTTCYILNVGRGSNISMSCIRK